MFRFVTSLILTTACLLSACNAVTLYCNFQNADVWNLTDVYTGDCTIQASGEARRVENVFPIGGHLPGLNNAMVRALIVSDYNMNFMLTNVEEKLPNLQSISFNRLNIGEVEVSDLDVFPQLRHLDLSQNAIQAIHRNLFATNVNLEAINLSQNPLKHIAHYVFNSLSNLRNLELMNSGCINVSSNASELEAVQFSLFLKCPPTSTMIGDEIINGESFETIIEALEDEIEVLRERIEVLEE